MTAAKTRGEKVAPDKGSERGISKKGGPEKKKETRRPRAIAIRLVGSGICAPRDQKATLIGLGLTRREKRVLREDTPAIRGMIRKVRHLVKVEE